MRLTIPTFGRDKTETEIAIAQFQEALSRIENGELDEVRRSVSELTASLDGIYTRSKFLSGNGALGKVIDIFKDDSWIRDADAVEVGELLALSIDMLQMDAIS